MAALSLRLEVYPMIIISSWQVSIFDTSQRVFGYWLIGKLMSVTKRALVEQKPLVPPNNHLCKYYYFE